jgi:hypothetical protein
VVAFALFLKILQVQIPPRHSSKLAYYLQDQSGFGAFVALKLCKVLQNFFNPHDRFEAVTFWRIHETS